MRPRSHGSTSIDRLRPERADPVRTLPRMRPLTEEALATCVAEDRAEAEHAVALEIAGLFRAKPGAVLGLATGSTMEGLYRELIRLARAGDLDLSRATTFNLDEYLGLPAAHPASFRAWTRAHLLDAVGLPADRARFPDVAATDLAAAGRGYEDAINALGGIDLQVLGIGPNGHIAFNEPGSGRATRTRDVDLSPSTREDAALAFGGLERVPLRAMTMGVATILDARRIRVLAFGARKAAIVRDTLRAPQGPDVPSTWLRGHADVRLYLDPEAASLL